MGALPLGERRRRIRPAARGERPHSQGGSGEGVRGSRGSPRGGSRLPPPRSPAGSAGAAGGAGSSPHACPRPTERVTESSTRSKPFTPHHSLPRRAAGCSPSPHKSEPPARPGGASTGRYRQLGACARRSRRCPSCRGRGRCQGLPGGRADPSPHKSKPPALPGGTGGGNGAAGGLSRSYLS